jgi:hypothetical protein
MSVLERKLSGKKEFVSIHPTGDLPEDINIPPRMHSFELWQGYVNSSFSELARETFNRCASQCEYDVAMMYGKKVSHNKQAENTCHSSCAYQWNNPYYQSVENSQIDAKKEFEKCLKGNKQFDIEPNDMLECKRVMFNTYLDSMLGAEQEYLKLALEKYA